ncbi:AFG1 family ATPase [Psychrobium sp. MM17-31]|uniref:cell division protein ZapE n=1 Tax=Psychrobium sp. MM17-31 TaxID=2917758 RepID=UPI001EF4FE18|nr:AFG1 family ATPase [Psychrobium sp. MM17-31]
MLTRYQAAVKAEQLTFDAIQLAAITALDERQKSLACRDPINGLYLYGRVGRGKTMVMDMFFDTLPSKRKLRLHFHHFMAQLHHKLNQLQGQVNPLEQVADDLAAQFDVICFDEFFVADIADAMLLGGVFSALHQRNIMIIATSNTVPDKLYEGGLARDRFLPAIALIKQHLEIFSLDGELDYRTQQTATNSVYFENDSHGFSAYCYSLELEKTNHSVNIYGRDLSVIGESAKTIWFDFMALCDGPRSQNDYMKLADSYDVIVLSDVLQMGGVIEEVTVAKGIEDGDTNYKLTPAAAVQIGYLDDCARRFIALVDEFYDRNKLLVIDAPCAIGALYRGGRVTKAFERTVSRLTQMQSQAYQDKVGQLNNTIFTLE